LRIDDGGGGADLAANAFSTLHVECVVSAHSIYDRLYDPVIERMVEIGDKPGDLLDAILKIKPRLAPLSLTPPPPAPKSSIFSSEILKP